jgi:hypothetical protein
LDALLTTLLYKQFTAAKPKEVKTGWTNLAETSKEGYGSNKAVLPITIIFSLISLHLVCEAH